MSCCRPTNLWLIKLKELNNELNQPYQTIVNEYLDSLSNVENKPKRPSVQKRLLIEALLKEDKTVLHEWLQQSVLKEAEANHTNLPKHYKPLITEIRDNYLNSNK